MSLLATQFLGDVLPRLQLLAAEGAEEQHVVIEPRPVSAGSGDDQVQDVVANKEMSMRRGRSDRLIQRRAATAKRASVSYRHALEVYASSWPRGECDSTKVARVLDESVIIDEGAVLS